MYLLDNISKFSKQGSGSTCHKTTEFSLANFVKYVRHLFTTNPLLWKSLVSKFYQIKRLLIIFEYIKTFLDPLFSICYEILNIIIIFYLYFYFLIFYLTFFILSKDWVLKCFLKWNKIYFHLRYSFNLSYHSNELISQGDENKNNNNQA